MTDRGESPRPPRLKIKINTTPELRRPLRQLPPDNISPLKEEIVRGIPLTRGGFLKTVAGGVATALGINMGGNLINRAAEATRGTEKHFLKELEESSQPNKPAEIIVGDFEIRVPQGQKLNIRATPHLKDINPESGLGTIVQQLTVDDGTMIIQNPRLFHGDITWGDATNGTGNDRWIGYIDPDTHKWRFIAISESTADSVHKPEKFEIKAGVITDYDKQIPAFGVYVDEPDGNTLTFQTTVTKKK